MKHVVASLLLMLAPALLGCEREPIVRVAGLTLRLSDAADCRPAREVSEVVVEAFGDFPPSDENTIDVLRPGAGPALIERFPADTRVVGARARAGTWEAGAARWLEVPLADQEGELLLLPPDRSCAVADPALGSTGRAAAFGRGALVLAGGSREGLGSRSLTRLAAGSQLATTSELELPREGHALVTLGDELFVLGGALGATGVAHDTFERFDADLAPLGLGRLTTPRRDFGAVSLADGVLLVGGRSSSEGPPLATTELVDATGSRARAELPTPRLEPRLVRLDDGVVVVAAGTGSGGGTLSEVLAYDPSGDEFVDTGIRIQPRRAWVMVGLPGARALLVSDGQEGAPTRDVVLVRSVGSALALALEDERVTIAGLPDLDQVRAVTLADGRVLLTGAEARAPAAYVIDLYTASATPVHASRIPHRLVDLADGTIAEIDPDGASLRRPVDRTRFHHPPATLLPEDLALDAPGHWETTGLELRAFVDDARADLATLRFADVEIALEVEDAGRGVEVLLRADGQPPTSLHVEPTEAGPALCRVERSAGEEVRFVREGTRITITTDLGERRCVLEGEGLDGPLGLGFRAPAGAALRNVRIRRLQ